MSTTLETPAQQLSKGVCNALADFGAQVNYAIMEFEKAEMAQEVIEVVYQAELAAEASNRDKFLGGYIFKFYAMGDVPEFQFRVDENRVASGRTTGISSPFYPLALHTLCRVNKEVEFYAEVKEVSDTYFKFCHNLFGVGPVTKKVYFDKIHFVKNN